MGRLRMVGGIVLLLSIGSCGAPALAQVVTVPRINNSNGGTVPGQASVLIGSNGLEKGTAGNPLVVTGASPRESFQLVASNVATAEVTVFGGDYVLSQACTAYGSLNFQVRGPDGVTYTTFFTKTASDPTNATGIVLGSYAVVRITITGTTGCNAILARVPS